MDRAISSINSDYKKQIAEMESNLEFKLKQKFPLDNKNLMKQVNEIVYEAQTAQQFELKNQSQIKAQVDKEMQSFRTEYKEQVADIERKLESRLSIKINESIKKEVYRFNQEAQQTQSQELKNQ